MQSAWAPSVFDFVNRASNAWNATPGVSLTSFYRDPESNRRVGGHPRSQHLVALAADFTGDRAQLLHLAGHARSVGLVAVLESDHLHLQLFPAGTI